MIKMRNSKTGQSLIDLIKSITRAGDMIRIVEVGSFSGESASWFLASGRVETIFCIDPWESGYPFNGKKTAHDMEAVERVFDSRHGNDTRVVKCKGTLASFLDRIERNEFSSRHTDLVYIDGCHDKEAVTNDISLSLSRLKPRIGIAGHDYNLPGVRSAVNELLGEPPFLFDDNSWFFPSGCVSCGYSELNTPTEKIVVYSTDGERDLDYIPLSFRSVRHFIPDARILVVTDHPSRFSNYGVDTYDPTSILSAVGFTRDTFRSKWSIMCLARLTIPLIPELSRYSRVSYLDSDTLVTSSEFSRAFHDDLLEHELCVSCYKSPKSYSRVSALFNSPAVTDTMRAELDARIWNGVNPSYRIYFNNGFSVYNIKKIRNDVSWYERRLMWLSDIISRGRFQYIEQDFENLFVDSYMCFPRRFCECRPVSLDSCVVRHFVQPYRNMMSATAYSLGI